MHETPREGIAATIQGDADARTGKQARARAASGRRGRAMKLLLVNPNTSPETTAAMVAIARASAPEGVAIHGATAASGAALITNPTEVEAARQAMLAMFEPVEPAVDGIILAAFADPALTDLRLRLTLPVTGIAEAGMAAAARGGRGFAVVTTTPALVTSIAALAARYGHAGAFLGTCLTEGDAHVVTRDPDLLPRALLAAAHRAVAELGAEAIVIGGGPLAVAARRIADQVPVPLIEPVPEAVKLATRRARCMRGET